MLGGADGRSLRILCATGSDPEVVPGKGAGAIYTFEVDVPREGLP